MKYGSWRSSGVGAVLLLATISFAAVPFEGRHRKLSSPFLAPLGSVLSFQLTPDGSRAVYLGGPNFDGTSGLFSVEADGSAAAALLDSSTSAAPVRWFLLSPDGTRVVYARDPGDDEIYSVPVDGGAAPVHLGSSSSVRISPDSTRLAFRSIGSGGHLVSVPITGGASTQLESMPVGENVEFLEFSEDGAFVAFTTRVDVSPGVANLRVYRVAADGSTGASLLGTWMSYGSLALVTVTATERVVLQARTTTGKPQLWSVPLDGTSSAALLHDPATWQVNSTIATRVSASGEWLAFSVPVPALQQSPLRSVRTDASGAALVIGQESQEGSFEFAGATESLVFKEGDTLFSAPCDGSSTPLQLTPTLAPSHHLDSFQLAADGARVTYIDVDLGASTRELYSASTGGGSVVKLNDPVSAPNSGVSRVVLDPSSTFAFFWMDEQGDGAIDVQRAPLDGSTAALEIASNVGYPRDGVPRASTARVLWLTSSTPDLISAAADGTTPPVVLNVELLEGSRLGDVTTFLFAPDGSSLVYLADGQADGAFDLYGVPLSSGGGPSALTDLAPFGKVMTFPAMSFTPDSSRVVFLAEDQVGDEDEVYSVPVDGSAAPTKLSLGQSVRSAPMVSSDGTKVGYLAGDSGANRLYVAPIDASAAPLQLNDALASNRSVTHAVLSGDRTRALYRVDQTTDEVYELYSVPLDASASPVKLSGTIPATADVIDIRSAAGRAVYQSDQAVDGKFELYSAPDDGSGAPVKLNHTLTATGTVDHWLVSPDGGWIVYRSRTSSSTKSNLYVVPSDGSAPPLNMSQTVAGDVIIYEISVDSSHIAFQSATGLWGSPIDASSPVVLLNPPLVPGGAIGAFEISPDASLVAYVATQENAGTSEVFCVAIDKSTPAVKLNGPLVAGGDVDPWIRFAPDSRHLLFSADALVDGRRDLFWAPVRGGSNLLVNPRLAPGQEIVSFEVSPDGEEVIYLGDLDEDDVVELYASRVVKGPLRSGPP